MGNFDAACWNNDSTFPRTDTGTAGSLLWATTDKDTSRANAGLKLGCREVRANTCRLIQPPMAIAFEPAVNLSNQRMPANTIIIYSSPGIGTIKAARPLINALPPSTEPGGTMRS
jgi:hypothetical protein